MELKLKNEVNVILWIKIKSYLEQVITKETNAIKERDRKKLALLKIPVDCRRFNNKLIYNYSYRSLTQKEENLLSKGWKYAMRLNTLNLLNVKTDLEYVFNSLEKNKLLTSSDESKKIRNLLNKFGKKINVNIKKEIPNISEEEKSAILSLKKDKFLVISKVGKGNAVVVLNKEDYLYKAKLILYDQRAFKKLMYNPTEEREDKFIKFLLKLKKNKMITEKEYKLMRPQTGSRTSQAYFLPKVHKQNLPMRPIISSYDFYNYNAARFLANLLTAATPEARSYIKDSFDFADKIRQNRNIYGLMFSLDVTALFTNVPLEKAIPIAIKKIRKYHPDLAINDENLSQLFKFSTMKTNFAFSNENYDQINGVSMGSPLAPTLAHLFISDLEN